MWASRRSSRSRLVFCAAPRLTAGAANFYVQSIRLRVTEPAKLCCSLRCCLISKIITQQDFFTPLLETGSLPHSNRVILAKNKCKSLYFCT